MSVVDAVESGRTVGGPLAQGIDHHSFTGTPREVAIGLYALPSRLVRQTFYALLLQGDRQAEVRIFERVAEGDRDCQVAVWEGASLGDLGERLAARCAGSAPAGTGPSGSDQDPVAAIEELLRGQGEFSDLGSAPAPPTARGAFGHPMRRYAQDRVVRAVVVAGGRAG